MAFIQNSVYITKFTSYSVKFNIYLNESQFIPFYSLREQVEM